MAQHTIRLLEWDTEFFGRRIARLDAGSSVPGAAELEQCCREERIELVQACVDMKDGEAISALEELDFHFVDTRIPMAGEVKDYPGNSGSDPCITVAEERDIPALRAVCHGSFAEVSRYSWRGFFPPAQVDAFYDTWLENGVRGKHDDFCFQYLRAGKVAGFATIKAHEKREVYIGIIAVAPAFRGNGVGDALVRQAFAYAAERKIPVVSSATQGRNSATQKLFSRHGMRMGEVQGWYYYEFSELSDQS